jgi:hypothetical protein
MSICFTERSANCPRPRLSFQDVSTGHSSPVTSCHGRGKYARNMCALLRQPKVSVNVPDKYCFAKSDNGILENDKMKRCAVLKRMGDSLNYIRGLDKRMKRTGPRCREIALIIVQGARRSRSIRVFGNRGAHIKLVQTRPCPGGRDYPIEPIRYFGSSDIESARSRQRDRFRGRPDRILQVSASPESVFCCPSEGRDTCVDRGDNRLNGEEISRNVWITLRLC